MPVQAVALAAALMSAQPTAPGFALVETVAASCYLRIEGVCKIKDDPNAPRAGNGGAGGNGTVNYNIIFGANPTGGNGGDGGDFRGPSGGRSGPAEAAKPPARPRQAPEAPAADLEGAVSYFTWTYNFEPEPGQRVWSRKGSRWSERYPSGKVAKVYDTVVPGAVQGCRGQLASHKADPGFEVFIPNVGCPRMVALFRRDMGAWSQLGPMRDVR